MHILLIEDDSKAAAYLVTGLTESGHVVDYAADGEDGFHMALALISTSGVSTTEAHRKFHNEIAMFKQDSDNLS